MFSRAVVLWLLAVLALQGQGTKGSSSEEMRPNPAAATPESSTLASCPAGGPLGEMEVTVHTSSNQPLPFINIVHLTEGDVVDYKPVDHGRTKRSGDVALVLVPTKISGKEQLIVTDPKSAEKPQEWKIPQMMSLAVFVYGPQGLSKKKVQSFLSQDDSLVAQLAEYADKTSQTQALIAALSSASSSSASVNAALTGFASQYGVAVQLDKTAPPAAQAQALFSAMNPQLANYNPMAGSGAAVAGQTASLATAAAGLFFGSPVGLLAGGTSMLLGLRSIAFPDTQFRSSFAQPLKSGHLNLCGDRGTMPPHTRIAYIWASRIPNAATPKIQIKGSNYIPLGQKSSVTATMADTDWKFLQRAREWYLEDEKNQRTPITVLKLENQKAIELDLTKTELSPGEYQLRAFWDWVPFGAEGEIHVRPLSKFETAALVPQSQDAVLARGGKIPVTLAGSDFEFTTKVELKKSADEFAVPQPVRFILPKGLRNGPQERMDVQLDTQDLDPGEYELLLSQQGAEPQPVRFKVLPHPPKIANLPVIVNQGVAAQHYVLKGERLDALTNLECPGVTIELGGTSAGNTERNITVQFEDAKKAEAGTKLPIKAYLRDRSEPLHFPDALEITGPLPAVASSKLSSPTGMAVAIHQDEFPAGYTLSAMLDVKNMERTSTLVLGCSDGTGRKGTLHVGEQTATSNLQQLSPDQVFLSFDTSNTPAGCELQATIDNGMDGRSRPFPLAHVISVPRIESFVLSPDTPIASQANPGETAASELSFVLTGTDLEMIAKVGWDSATGVDVTNLPVPVPGQGQKQTLTVKLPDPSSSAPTAPGSSNTSVSGNSSLTAPSGSSTSTPSSTLYVWLRGDREGRRTTIQYAPSPFPRAASK